MDIVTHALMSYALAAPAMPSAPITAGCFILGSVLPDLNSLSRVFGKRAFLQCHQTYTHGILALPATGIAAWILIPPGFHEPWAPAALVAGMLLHVLLDVTNTYGTAILSPVSPRRFCTEWIFFIDSVVVFASVVAVLLQWLDPPSISSAAVAGIYGLSLLIYWAMRIVLYRRARTMAPAGTTALIPSALIPWRYFGYAREGDHVLLFRINALSGHVDQQAQRPIFDAAFTPVLMALPEFRIMRELSPAYHVVEARRLESETHIICRDLRVRNFGGRFGELLAVLDSDGHILRRDFHV